MNLNQLTDTQLINQIDILGQQILDTSASEQWLYERLAIDYDAVQAELDSRGLW